MVNTLLRSRIVLRGTTQKEVADEMGINHRVFGNKINRRIVNGYEARFTDEQKAWLAEKFQLDVNEIE